MMRRAVLDAVLDNARLSAFVAGLALILTVERETLALLYLGAGFLWFIVWLVAGDHSRDPIAPSHTDITDLARLGNSFGRSE